MAWLFSCFRCKQRRQRQSSSSHPDCKIAVENAVPRNAPLLKAQDVIQERAHSYMSLEQSLDASKQGNEADRSLFSFLKTETTCYSQEKQSSDQPIEKEGLQHVINKLKKVKDLKDEANDLQELLDSPNNCRRALGDLQGAAEEGQAEKGRHMACLNSLLTKMEHEGETLVVDDLKIQEQNILDCNNGKGMGEALLSSTENKSQLCDIEAPKGFYDCPLSFSLATQEESSLSLEEESDLISPVRTLLERTFPNWRGCSSETKMKQSDQRRDDLFDSTPQTMEERLLLSRSKRSSKALSFSEFSLVEADADSKLASKKLELENFKRTESCMATRTIGIKRVTALRGETDDQFTTRESFTNASGSGHTSSVSQDVFYDTDIEVDSKAVKPHINKNSLGRPHGFVQTLEYNAHEGPSFADSTMEQSQAFTFGDAYNNISETFSQFFTECNSKMKVLDEEVKALDIDQISNCFDGSSFLSSPLLQRLSERDKLFLRKRIHLQATPRVSPMLQEGSAESSADCGKPKHDRELGFALPETAGGWMKRPSQESLNSNTRVSMLEINSKDIHLPEESRQFFANIEDLASEDNLLPSKLLDDITSRPSRCIDMSPESHTYSHIEHMKEISCDELASLEAASFSAPSPETVTSMTDVQSPLLLGGAKEASSMQRIILNSPQKTPSLSKSVLQSSSTNFLKHQRTPGTPSASSSQVETPNSIQSVVSPADIAKDRPIMGTVAAHWSHSSSKEKWWDGKGIPNSTNKYKEDQKVSWHATPFEVRLERALAKQGRIFQKKLFGGSMPTEMELRTEPITSSG